MHDSPITAIIHLITLILSVALFAISLRAWRQKRHYRLQILCWAFAVFALQNALLLAYIGYPSEAMMAGAHLLSIVVILLFFGGMIGR